MSEKRPERLYPFWCITKHLLSSIRNLQEEGSKTGYDISEYEKTLYTLARRLIELDGGDFPEHENLWEAVMDLVEAEKHCQKQKKLFCNNLEMLKELQEISLLIRSIRVSIVKSLLKGHKFEDVMKEELKSLEEVKS